ncbi:hypothetical protein HGP28_06870 [Vibrio sp. SM6]|uniref:Uncharacterized protein n=1 Tax=Vibrio agarilyticus TaxID=2726741 RepID=A0A7X8YGJ9_9VIBR|nr:hypothetical protein [Vibrio agarilyticus]NLS12625.1 hypothetical protein [Vibrio agarilyticus]
MSHILQQARQKRHQQSGCDICKKAQQASEAMLSQFETVAKRCFDSQDHANKREHLKALHLTHQEFCQSKAIKTPHSL